MLHGFNLFLKIYFVVVTSASLSYRNSPSPKGSVVELKLKFLTEGSQSSVVERNQSSVTERSQSSVTEHSQSSVTERGQSSVTERSRTSVVERSRNYHFFIIETKLPKLSLIKSPWSTAILIFKSAFSRFKGIIVFTE